MLLMAKSDYSYWERVLYGPFYTLARLLWRVRIHQGKKVVDYTSGGAVVIANHRCSLDPFFVQLAAGRRVHWMVAAEYFKHPLFGAVLKILQAIPTNRSGSDGAATRMAVKLAGEGRLIGMFPEGRLNKTCQPLITMRAGALLVSRKAEAAIVPMWIRGAPIGADVWNPLLMPAAVTIRVGQPHQLPSQVVDGSRKEQTEWIKQRLLDVKHDSAEDLR